MFVWSSDFAEWEVEASDDNNAELHNVSMSNIEDTCSEVAKVQTNQTPDVFH